MREIKFRGKDLLKGEWRYGYLHLPTGGDNLMIQVDNYNSFGVIPKTIGQYTGLKDKNGKEIYEGDIVRCKDSDRLGKVYFHQCAYRVDFGNCLYTLNIVIDVFDISVIGNIHSNKGLL